MAFGNDGSYSNKIGNSFSYEKNGKTETYRKVGNSIFGSDSSYANKVGSTTIISKGPKSASFRKIGDGWHSSDGTTYRKMGDTLRSSKGMSWYHVQSDSEAESIIMADIKNSNF